MPLFQQFFGKRRFRRLSDSFTLSDTTKFSTLCQWVDQQSSSGNSVLVLSHFQSTFLQNQDALQEAGVEFEILASPTDEAAFVERFRDPGERRVILTMAQMLTPSAPVSQTVGNSQQRSGTRPVVGTKNPAIDSATFSVIVTERYPIVANDQRLEQFFRQCPAAIALGYLISFEDPMLRHLLGERFIGLLKQLGLGANDLISSTMTNRELARQLARATDTIDQEQPAESPEEWIQLNLD